MPYKKLTLRIEADLIEQGKRYAEAHGTSISQLLMEQLRGLLAEAHRKASGQPLRAFPIDPELEALVPERTTDLVVPTSKSAMRETYYNDKD